MRYEPHLLKRNKKHKSFKSETPMHIRLNNISAQKAGFKSVKHWVQHIVQESQKKTTKEETRWSFISFPLAVMVLGQMALHTLSDAPYMTDLPYHALWAINHIM